MEIITGMTEALLLSEDPSSPSYENDNEEMVENFRDVSYVSPGSNSSSSTSPVVSPLDSQNSKTSSFAAAAADKKEGESAGAAATTKNNSNNNTNNINNDDNNSNPYWEPEEEIAVGFMDVEGELMSPAIFQQELDRADSSSALLFANKDTFEECIWEPAYPHLVVQSSGLRWSLALQEVKSRKKSGGEFQMHTTSENVPFSVSVDIGTGGGSYIVLFVTFSRIKGSSISSNNNNNNSRSSSVASSAAAAASNNNNNNNDNNNNNNGQVFSSIASLVKRAGGPQPLKSDRSLGAIDYRSSNGEMFHATCLPFGRIKSEGEMLEMAAWLARIQSQCAPQGQRWKPFYY